MGMRKALKKIRGAAAMVVWTIAGMAGAQPSTWGAEPSPEGTEPEPSKDTEKEATS
jgi:hypothetical protein